MPAPDFQAPGKGRRPQVSLSARRFETLSRPTCTRHLLVTATMVP